MIWLAFGIGVFVGTFAGILIAGLCQAAAESNKYDESLQCHYCNYDALEHPVLAEET